jgi:nucleoid-associated protein YgaU
MPTGRWKKLAIAGAILIVGIGTALVFRREHTAEAPAAAQAPEALGQSPATRAAQRKPPPEPTLAGRIEPYSPAAPTDSVREASASFTTAARDPLQTDSPMKWQTVRRPDESHATAVTQPDRPTVDRILDDSPPAARRLAADVRHKIVDGDTLAAIARRYLGAGERSLELFEYNRDVLVTPELLPIGKELRIPPRDFSPAQSPLTEPRSLNLTAVAPPIATTQKREVVATAPSISTAITAAKPSAQTYVVEQHDTLALIARKLYGDISRQGDLLAANRNQLRSPKDLRPGMTLNVPAAPRDSRAYDGLSRPSH